MKESFLLSMLFCVFSFSAFSQIPVGYYDSANGLSGELLKSALNEIIDGHTEYSYEAVKDALRITDEDTLNSDNVICFYSGWSYGKYDFGNGSEEWNREHIWSKSHGDFGDYPPAGTDLHHLRPADASVNSAKNNRDFDYGVQQYIDGSGVTQCSTDTYIWEPRDEVKGDVARMLFYMATRYEGENGDPDLELVNYVNSSPAYEPFYGNISTLLQWHTNDPVDGWEINRNNIIYYNYQGNRNPFIDHPEYVDLIWEQVLPEPSNHVSGFTIAGTSNSALTLNWSDNNGTIPAERYLLLGNASGVFTTPVDGTEENDDLDFSDGEARINISSGDESYTFYNLENETTYYFKIFPYTNFGLNTDYKTDGDIPVTSGIPSGISILIISEVSDPADSSYAKFVELYNAGTLPIDFSSEVFYLCRQANGGTWADVQLTGIIQAQSTYILAYSASKFTNSYGSTADLNSGNISGNGNDGYFLFYGGGHATGVLVDAYGVIDQNGTGQAWEYTDSKAVRKYSDTISSVIWNPDEWIINNYAGFEDMTPVKHHLQLIWTGSNSTQWDDKLNWMEGSSGASFKPDAGSRLIIPDVMNSPEITTESSCDKIHLEENAVLSITTGKLKIGH